MGAIKMDSILVYELLHKWGLMVYNDHNVEEYGVKWFVLVGFPSK